MPNLALHRKAMSGFRSKSTGCKPLSRHLTSRRC